MDERKFRFSPIRCAIQQILLNVYFTVYIYSLALLDLPPPEGFLYHTILPLSRYMHIVVSIQYIKRVIFKLNLATICMYIQYAVDKIILNQ